MTHEPNICAEISAAPSSPSKTTDLDKLGSDYGYDDELTPRFDRGGEGDTINRRGRAEDLGEARDVLDLEEDCSDDAIRPPQRRRRQQTFQPSRQDPMIGA